MMSQHRASGLVFPSRRGTRRREHKCDVGLRRCAERAGLKPLGWHVLRHTYASHLVMAGVPLPVVQQLLGHTDIRLTLRDAHLSPGQRSESAQKSRGGEIRTRDLLTPSQAR
jgi:site-specific recombinase XerD